MNIAANVQSPLQQLFQLEERVRQADVHLPEEGELKQKFHGIKCLIGGTPCVVNMQSVAEVLDERQATAIPGAANWIDGVINYRGVLVPVYRPGELLVCAESVQDSAKAEGPLMVIRRDRKGQEFIAIRVDRVFGIEKIREDSMQQPEQLTVGPESLLYYTDECISGESESWHLLNTTKLLNMMAARQPGRQ